MSTKMKPFTREHFPDSFCPCNRLPFMTIYSLNTEKTHRACDVTQYADAVM